MMTTMMRRLSPADCTTPTCTSRWSSLDGRRRFSAHGFARLRHSARHNYVRYSNSSAASRANHTDTASSCSVVHAASPMPRSPHAARRAPSRCSRTLHTQRETGVSPLIRRWHCRPEDAVALPENPFLAIVHGSDVRVCLSIDWKLGGY